MHFAKRTGFKPRNIRTAWNNQTSLIVHCGEPTFGMGVVSSQIAA
jgi:hypothetical protein